MSMLRNSPSIGLIFLRKVGRTVLVSALVVVSVMAVAQEVAVLSLNEAVQRTEYFKAKAEQLREQEDFSELLSQGEAISSKLESLQERVRRESDTLSEDDFRSMQREAEEASSELQLVENKLQSRQQSFFAQVAEELEQDLRAVVNQIYTARKIRILMNRTPELAIIVDPSVDITEDVARGVDRLREERGNEEGEEQ